VEDVQKRRPSGASQPATRARRAPQLLMCSNISTETMRSNGRRPEGVHVGGDHGEVGEAAAAASASMWARWDGELETSVMAEPG